MPMHDWTRVSAGIFHHFHNAWITHLSDALNDECLPPDYYALGEQRSGNIGPDVLTLHSEEAQPSEEGGPAYSVDCSGMIAVAEVPPRVSISQDAADDAAFYLERQRTVAIRHTSGDRIVAMIEIVSPHNKRGLQALDEFVDKIVVALREEVHVMIIDALPRGRHDPQGIHGAVWERMMAGEFELPKDLPLTLVSYAARPSTSAYVEPIRVGSALIDMPLFLTPDHYIPVPLEDTYQGAWSGVPRRWRQVIESVE